MLIGSGVSTGAGIPTGWEIVLDLIGRVAEVTEDESPADLEAWYLDRFGHEPTYSHVLARLGRTAAEREATIRGFIEPSDDAPGRRPPAAHRGLARLAQAKSLTILLGLGRTGLPGAAPRQGGPSRRFGLTSPSLRFSWRTLVLFPWPSASLPTRSRP